MSKKKIKYIYKQNTFLLVQIYSLYILYKSIDDIFVIFELEIEIKNEGQKYSLEGIMN